MDEIVWFGSTVNFPMVYLFKSIPLNMGADNKQLLIVLWSPISACSASDGEANSGPPKNKTMMTMPNNKRVGAHKGNLSVRILSNATICGSQKKSVVGKNPSPVIERILALWHTDAPLSIFL
jgi:hypothetical protein